jgi:hypothetical protein
MQPFGYGSMRSRKRVESANVRSPVHAPPLSTYKGKRTAKHSLRTFLGLIVARPLWGREVQKPYVNDNHLHSVGAPSSPGDAQYLVSTSTLHTMGKYGVLGEAYQQH